jgi:hypothetical protein
MVKTTVYLEPDTALGLRHLAGVKKRSQAELIREAVRSYVSENRVRPPNHWGQFESKGGDVASRRKEILAEIYLERAGRRSKNDGADRG